ncbi:MAG: hypothetical protein H6672_17145 [Anaerolineaceae bacterium]|nr:hypothetical protein [Anaerolineaceae bacterium]
MRHFERLDHVSIDTETHIISLTTTEDVHSKATMAMRREGAYLVVSASYGPLEISLRLRLEEFTHVLERIQPVSGLQTTRQVGTGQASLALGAQTSGELILRPTIVADATGHFSFNLLLSTDARQSLYNWLEIKDE